VSHVPGTSSASVLAALQDAVNSGAFNGHLQDDALTVGAMGLASATSGKLTASASGGNGAPQQQSSSATQEGVSSGAAAGIAIAVIFIFFGIVGGYFYYTKNIAGRDRKATELFSGTNIMFGGSSGGFDNRRPTAGLGTFGDVHNRDSGSSAGLYGEQYPSLSSGTRTNPLRDRIPDPAQFSARRLGGLAGHEDL